MMLALVAFAVGVAVGYLIGVAHDSRVTQSRLNAMHEKMISALCDRDHSEHDMNAMRSERDRYEAALGTIEAAIEESRKVEG